MAGRKKHLLTEIEEILQEADKSEELKLIEKNIAHYMTVRNFNGYGADKQHEKDFEKLCATIQRHTQKDIKAMTTFEFYSLITVLK